MYIFVVKNPFEKRPFWIHIKDVILNEWNEKAGKVYKIKSNKTNCMCVNKSDGKSLKQTHHANTVSQLCMIAELEGLFIKKQKNKNNI